MLFEQVLFLIAIGIAVFMIGIPLIKLVKSIVPATSKDPLVEAHKRLEIAKKEAEAARLNKEAEQLYNKMYQEALEDSDSVDDKKTRIEK